VELSIKIPFDRFFAKLPFLPHQPMFQGLEHLFEFMREDSISRTFSFFIFITAFLKFHLQYISDLGPSTRSFESFKFMLILTECLFWSTEWDWIGSGRFNCRSRNVFNVVFLWILCHLYPWYSRKQYVFHNCFGPNMARAPL
jgi:hypothetical protein